MAEALPGVVFGVAFAVVAAGLSRGLGPERGAALLALLLPSAAAVYVGAAWGDPRSAPVLEALAFGVFLGVALLGWRRPGVLAAGWAAHMGWDVLHLAGPFHSAAPVWYSVACLVADPLLAVWLVWWAPRSALADVTNPPAGSYEE